MKIAVFTFCIGNDYQKKWASANRSKEIYSKLHNYDFIYLKESLAPERNPHWSKILGLLNNLEKYDWIFYSDADAHIMNFDIKLESFIERYHDDDNNNFLIITKDNVCLNSGNFLIKNCKESLNYLRDSYTHYPPQKNYRIGNYLCNFNDQFGMYLESISPKYSNNICYIPQRELNAYICKCCGEQYKAGDFLIHFVNHKKSTHGWG
jgi:hypothetical protein